MPNGEGDGGLEQRQREFERSVSQTVAAATAAAEAKAECGALDEDGSMIIQQIKASLLPFSKDCLICMKKTFTTHLFLCEHHVCDGCLEHLEPKKCPMCRTVFTEQECMWHSKVLENVLRMIAADEHTDGDGDSYFRAMIGKAPLVDMDTVWEDAVERCLGSLQHIHDMGFEDAKDVPVKMVTAFGKYIINNLAELMDSVLQLPNSALEYGHEVFSSVDYELVKLKILDPITSLPLAQKVFLQEILRQFLDGHSPESPLTWLFLDTVGMDEAERFVFDNFVSIFCESKYSTTVKLYVNGDRYKWPADFENTKATLQATNPFDKDVAVPLLADLARELSGEQNIIVVTVFVKGTVVRVSSLLPYENQHYIVEGDNGFLPDEVRLTEHPVSLDALSVLEKRTLAWEWGLKLALSNEILWKCWYDPAEELDALLIEQFGKYVELLPAVVEAAGAD